MLSALIFDMNGVIVDDMPFHERAWIALSARHGRTLTPDEFRSVMSGRRNRDNVYYIFGSTLPDEKVRAYQLEKEQAYREAYRAHLAPLPGLLPLLVEARKAGLKLAVATSAPPDNIAFVLDGLDLRRHFDAVVGEAEVQRAKPDPEIYLKAASRLGVDANTCVVFEDSLAGIASGLAAGMPVVGVTTTHTADELGHCALAIADYCTLAVADLARLV